MDEMPVFVKVEDYQDVLDMIGELREKVEHAKSLIHNIHELKEEEESELEAWRIGLEDVEQKIANLGSLLKQ